MYKAYTLDALIAELSKFRTDESGILPVAITIKNPGEPRLGAWHLNIRIEPEDDIKPRHLEITNR